MKLGIWLRRLAPVLFSVILAACGEGGGSDNSPRLTVSQNNISFSASQDDYTPPAISFTAAVSNANQSVYVGVFYSNTGIDSIDYEISGSSGAIDVYPRSPESLAPGTYTDAIEINVCLDSMCNSPIAGSPQIVNVTYTVAPGNPISATPNPLSFEAVEVRTVTQQTVNLSVATGTVPTWTANISYATSSGWITLTEDHIANSIAINLTSQVAGTYTATLYIDYNLPSGRPQALAIPITYQATDIWSIASGTSFTIDVNTQSTALTKSLPININTDFGSNIPYTASSDSPWLTISNSTSNTATYSSLTLNVDSGVIASMDNGSYQASVTLISTTPGYPSKTATVDMSLILPTIQQVSPYVAYTGDSTQVTLAGVDLLNAAGHPVIINSTNVAGISILNDTHASITLPPLPNGEYTVGIRNALGIMHQGARLLVRSAPSYEDGEISLPGILESLVYDAERDVFYGVFWDYNYANVAPPVAKRIRRIGSVWQIDTIDVPYPQALTLTADGREILVATNSGVYRIDPDTLTQLGSSGFSYNLNTIHAFADGRVLTSIQGSFGTVYNYPSFTTRQSNLVYDPDSVLSYNRNRMLWAEIPAISGPHEIYYYDEATDEFTEFSVNDPNTYFFEQLLAMNADGTRVIHNQDVYQDFNYVGSLNGAGSVNLPTLTRDGYKAVVLDIYTKTLSQYDLSGNAGPFPKIGDIATLSDNITMNSKVLMSPNDQTVFVFGTYEITQVGHSPTYNYKLYIRNLP